MKIYPRTEKRLIGDKVSKDFKNVLELLIKYLTEIEVINYLNVIYVADLSIELNIIDSQLNRIHYREDLFSKVFGNFNLVDNKYDRVPGILIDHKAGHFGSGNFLYIITKNKNIYKTSRNRLGTVKLEDLRNKLSDKILPYLKYADYLNFEYNKSEKNRYYYDSWYDKDDILHKEIYNKLDSLAELGKLEDGTLLDSIELTEIMEFNKNTMNVLIPQLVTTIVGSLLSEDDRYYT